jgi:regulatory protein
MARPGAANEWSGRELDPEPDAESVARNICLHLLTQRARTRAELASALRRRAVPDDVSARTLDRFTELGLIDDRALAGNYAQAQHRERGLARQAVAVKLRRRGVDEQTVRASVAEIDRDSELETARRLVARRQRTMAALEPATRARRLTGMLARRGYPAELARQVVREALSAPELTALGADTE